MLSKHLILTDTKEANDARAAERAKLGIGRDFKIINRPIEHWIPGLAIDPQYARELGISNKFSEEL